MQPSVKKLTNMTCYDKLHSTLVDILLVSKIVTKKKAVQEFIQANQLFGYPPSIIHREVKA